jgi:hypothetical protein
MKRAEEYADLALINWPTDAPHFNLLREGIRDMVTKAVRLAMADEREQCAKVADSKRAKSRTVVVADVADEIADAIRRRGKVTP